MDLKFRALVLLVLSGACLDAHASGDVVFPAPIAQFASQFAQECEDNGMGELIKTENYSEVLHGPADFNRDGVRDYIVYKCMFGCSRAPNAFAGTGMPCPWGSLLLSGAEGHRQVFLPGVVTAIHTDQVLKIEVRRPRTLRLLGNYCNGGFGNHDIAHLYEFKDRRFQLLGRCSTNGCHTLVPDADD